ncbi:MAG: DUF2848 family protein, partial [Halomonadaceae bacterium]
VAVYYILEVSIVTGQDQLHPKDLLQRFGLDEPKLAPGQAMLCGTLPVIGGVRPSEAFRMVLEDPVTDRKIEHFYEIKTLSVVK